MNNTPPLPSFETVALILAAGNSSRFGLSLSKVYYKIENKCLLSRSIHTFTTHPLIDAVCVVIQAQDTDHYNEASKQFDLLPYVIGGLTRKQSVLNGLNFLSSYQPKKLLIHDAARPFVSSALITNVVNALDNAEAVDVLLPVVDTIKRLNNDLYEPVAREHLYQTQTPQGFLFPIIHKLHQKTIDDMSDDISLYLQHKNSISFVRGEITNYKITFSQDLK